MSYRDKSPSLLDSGFRRASLSGNQMPRWFDFFLVYDSRGIILRNECGLNRSCFLCSWVWIQEDEADSVFFFFFFSLNSIQHSRIWMRQQIRKQRNPRGECKKGDVLVQLRVKPAPELTLTWKHYANQQTYWITERRGIREARGVLFKG